MFNIQHSSNHHQPLQSHVYGITGHLQQVQISYEITVGIGDLILY